MRPVPLILARPLLRHAIYQTAQSRPDRIARGTTLWRPPATPDQRPPIVATKRPRRTRHRTRRCRNHPRQNAPHSICIMKHSSIASPPSALPRQLSYSPSSRSCSTRDGPRPYPTQPNASQIHRRRTPVRQTRTSFCNRAMSKSSAESL